jgi:hypothetical protein
MTEHRLSDEHIPIAIRDDDGYVYDGFYWYCPECADGIHRICSGGRCTCPHPCHIQPGPVTHA